jgi:hypothetical protein
MDVVQRELGEFLWISSLVTGLSLIGVGLAVGLAIAMVHLPH